MLTDAYNVLNHRYKAGFDHPGNGMLKEFLADHGVTPPNPPAEFRSRWERRPRVSPEDGSGQGPAATAADDIIGDNWSDDLLYNLQNAKGATPAQEIGHRKSPKAWVDRLSEGDRDHVWKTYSKYAGGDNPAAAKAMEDALGMPFIRRLERDVRRREGGKTDRGDAVRRMDSSDWFTGDYEDTAQRGMQAAEARRRANVRARLDDTRRENLAKGGQRDPVTGKYSTPSLHDRANEAIVNAGRSVAGTVGRGLRDAWKVKQLLMPGKFAKGALAHRISGMGEEAMSGKTAASEAVKARASNLHESIRAVEQVADKPIDFGRVFLAVENKLSKQHLGIELDPKLRRYETTPAQVLKEWADRDDKYYNVAGLEALYEQVKTITRGTNPATREGRHWRATREAVQEEIRRQGPSQFADFIDELDNYEDFLHEQRKSVSGGRWASDETALRRMIAARSGRGRGHAATRMRDSFIQALDRHAPTLDARLAGVSMDDWKLSGVGRLAGMGGIGAVGAGAMSPLAFGGLD